MNRFPMSPRITAIFLGILQAETDLVWDPDQILEQPESRIGSNRNWRRLAIWKPENRSPG